MKQFNIEESTLEQLDDLMMEYGSTGLICELVNMFDERAQMIAAIQYGFGSAERDDNEDTAVILEELRKAYPADTAHKASSRSWLLRTLCELICEVDAVLAQYNSQSKNQTQTA